MTSPYAAQIDEILDDFLARLRDNAAADPQLVAQLTAMIAQGTLADSTTINLAVDALRERGHEPQD
jgi:hypothetical protein